MSPQAVFVRTKRLAMLQQSQAIDRKNQTVLSSSACSHVRRSVPRLMDISFPYSSRHQKPVALGGGRTRWVNQAAPWFVSPPAAPMLSVCVSLCTRCSVNKLWRTRASWFGAASSFTQTAWKVMPLRSLDVRAEGSREVSIYVFINAFYSREPAVAS